MGKKLIIGLLLDDTLDRSDGVQQATVSIGEELRKRGHEVHYIVAESMRTDLKNVHSIGKFLSLKFNGNSVRTPLPVSKRIIRALFTDIKFDVLHVQMPYSPFFSARVLSLAPQKVKKIGTFHILPYSFVSKFGTKLLGMMLRKSINSLDRVFAVSLPAKVFMDEVFKTKGGVLPNPINYHYFSSGKKRQQKNKKIVFVGRFEERKGVRQLVEAYAGLQESLRERTDLIMVGKGPLVDQVRERAKQLNVKVHFPGFVTEEEKVQLLTDADIAVFPSISGESFGIVLTEAMAAGAGVTIGGDNPGYASVLQGWPESLFDPNDLSGFTKKIELFLQNDDKRLALGHEQHKAVKQYDIMTIVNELELVYGA